MLNKTLIVIKIHTIHKWQIQEQIKMLGWKLKMLSICVQILELFKNNLVMPDLKKLHKIGTQIYSNLACAPFLCKKV